MKPQVKIIKYLEMLKTALELEEDDLIKMQATKIQQENIEELLPVVNLLDAPQQNREKILKLIDDYIFAPKDGTLTSHQQEIFDAIVSDFELTLKISDVMPSKNTHFIALSGFAGVGKTFVTTKLIEHFVKKLDYKVLLTTPTHKSLEVAKYMLNLQGLSIPTRTLHSYLDIRLVIDFLKGTKVFKRDKIDGQFDYEKDLDILIVDESSMVSNELLEFIVENLEQSKLKSVLFIGDPYQLPPVDEGQNGVESLPKKYFLKEVVRQAKDSYIKMIAIRLKDCIKDKKYIPIMEIFDTTKYPQLKIFYETKDMYDDFCLESEWFKNNKIVLSYTNSEVDAFNRVLRNRYWAQQNIFPKDALIVGDIIIFNETYQDDFRNSEIVTLAKVEKKQNNAIEVDVDGEKVPLLFFDCTSSDGRTFKAVSPDHSSGYNAFLLELSKEARNTKNNEERKKLWRRYFAIKNEYADIKYIHASTIHKSQGSTFNTVYIDLASLINLSHKDKDLAYRLMYVAVTRAAKDIKILL